MTEQVESSSKVVSQIHEEVKSSVQNESQANLDPTPVNDDGSLLEQTFEFIPQTTMSNKDVEDTETLRVGRNRSISSNDLDSSGSKSKESMVHERTRKSGSFLSKFQSTFPDPDDESPRNIPSSIVNAFTSLTSSFNLSSSSTNGTINNNNNSSSSSLAIETSSVSTRLSQITESKEDIFARKAALERKNLISLTNLIVKDLISSSLQADRTITYDCQNTIHLNNYFTLIDRVLKHGLKQNLLTNKSVSLWNALDSLPKYLRESTLMSESVRSLANTKTPDGKIKAWMRLAMMQKKLPEYFNELLANRNVLLKDIYHDYAFMLNDEAQVFAGLIIGVNVIDCNFFVKDANFDLMDDIIDLSPYLRTANNSEGDDEQDSTKTDPEFNKTKAGNLEAILDQKSYLEEWNKRLEDTIANLQMKIKNLEEQNSKLEMEAKVSEARIMKLTMKGGDQVQDRAKSSSSLAGTLKNLIKTTENAIDKQSLTGAKEESNIASPKPSEAGEQDKSSGDLEAKDSQDQKVSLKEQKDIECSSSDEAASIQADREQELHTLRERVSILETSYRSSLEKIKTLERDLDVQTSSNSDKETSIMRYEKDIRDKQAQVENLRKSLADSKKLNSELNERFNDTSARLKERIKSINTLQTSLDKWKLENKTLAVRLQDKLAALKTLSKELDQAKVTIAELKSYNEKINDELRQERQTGQSSSVTLESQNSKINELNNRLIELEKELTDTKPYRDRTSDLEKKCKDYEQSLEEIGSQLRESRLEVESLRENSAVFLDSQWINSKQIKHCALCQQLFSVTRRKHHCRLCGNVFCQTCSDNKMELASSSKPVRVCDTCHAFLLAKFVKSSS